MLEKIKSFLAYSFEPTKDIKITISAILILLTTLVITHFILRFIRQIASRKLNEYDRNRFKTVFTFVKYIIFSIVIIGTLDASGVEVTTLLAASTAFFVALGLGMQKLVQDVISGIFILVDRTITVNDIIEVSGKVGKVTKISLITTKAITNDNKILIIPNHKFLNEVVYNWTQNSDITREYVDIGVAYGTDIELLKTLLLNIADEDNRILKEPTPGLLFLEFGDNALQFRLHFHVQDSFAVPLLKSDLRYKIYNEFQDNAINIPFPQRDIHIISNPEK
ncbi:mechanosensitive ion channel family protein [Pontimicrobium sp. MEBiC01747]|jgi:small-conductance mechanosensitive channel